jgi:DNA invertase Pin-like site-specific DNA recombinase
MKALSYCRISDKEQSHFSLDGQLDIIKRFASRQGIEIAASFTDDGKSARNMERPAWKELENYLSVNKGITHVIVAKYDRFSRNTELGLTFIRRAQEKWGVVVVSASETFDLRMNPIVHFQFLVNTLAAAEIQWMHIQQNTLFGIWKAKKSGRYISKAPWGYLNSSDALGKPFIIPDERRFQFVEKAYDMYLIDASYKDILLMLKSSGSFSLSGHSAVNRILSNQTYAGLVLVPPFSSEPGHITKGVFEGIVTEAKFWAVQKKMQEVNNRNTRTIDNDEFPLRGIVGCSICGHGLTGAKSKGASGKRYGYYKCNKCKGQNFRAEVAHAELEQMFDELSLCSRTVTEAASAAREKFAESESKLKKEQQELHTKSESLAKDLDSLEERYIKREIETVTYEKWRGRWERERGSVQSRILDISNKISQATEITESKLLMLSDLKALWNKANLSQKRQLLLILFEQLVKLPFGYRTTNVHDIIKSNSLTSSLLHVSKNTKTPPVGEVLALSSPDGSLLELLTQFETD